MEKIYDNLKLFKTKKFKTRKEENDYFINIQEENIFEYKQSLLEKFKDYYHVMWSRKIIIIGMSFLLLSLSMSFYYMNNIPVCIILFSLSLSSIFISLYFQKLLNKKLIEENFVMHFIDKHISEEYGIVLNNN